MMVALAAATTLAAQATAATPPPFDLVEKTAKTTLAERQGYRAGDLLSRDQAKEAIDRIASAGWRVPDAEELIERVPSSRELMPQALATPGGRKLMRRLNGDWRAYDRLDRLSQLPDGRQILHRLTTEPGGEKLLEYLQTKGGVEMGRMLSKTNVRNFNKPTEKIYTEDQFLAALKKSYEKAIATTISRRP